jgi:HSP20 family molecular chaperone IbpA
VDVEKSNQASARRLAQKKSDIELEEHKLQMEQARAARDRQRMMETEREKSEKTMVEISAAATQQMDSLKKLNTDRVRALSDNNQKHYETLAAVTAEEIKRIDEDAFRTVQDRKLSAMDKVKNVTDRSQDPFYQLRSLSPVFSEGDKAYTVRVSLPAHEEKNLFVSGEGQYLKVTLARRYQDHATNQGTMQTTKTSSFQTLVEQIPIPGAFDTKKISREYKDGVVTITLPKVSFEPKELQDLKG